MRTREETLDGLAFEADRSGDCILATRGKGREGYCRVRAGGRMTLAHRLAYEVCIGPIAEGFTVDHECHNRTADCPGGAACPHRRCINPLHLVARDSVDNWRRGRLGFPAHGKAQTHCKFGHEFTEGNTYRFGPDKRYRSCRRCHADREARRRG